MSISQWTESIDHNPARRQALAPYLDRLRQWNAGFASITVFEKAARIQVGGQTVTIQPWVRQQIRVAFADAGLGAELPTLLSRGLALMIKGLADAERMLAGSLSEKDFYTHQAELMLDAALGGTLMSAIQGEVERLVQAGHRQPAHELSQFGHELNRAVARIRATIADSEQRRFDEGTQAEEMSEAPPVPTPPMATDTPRRVAGEPRPSSATRRPAAMQPDLETPRPRRRPRPATRSASRAVAARSAGAERFSRTTVLGVALAALCLAWVLIAYVPARMSHDSAAVTRDDFAEFEPVRLIRDRHPSLYVTVDDRAWRELGEASRRRMLQGLGGSAEVRGFRGVLVTTAEGRPVGQWLSLGGVKVIAPLELETPQTAPF